MGVHVEKRKSRALRLQGEIESEKVFEPSKTEKGSERLDFTITLSCLQSAHLVVLDNEGCDCKPATLRM